MDPERLRRQFPALTDDDVAAYAEVTRRILAAPPAERARVTREVLQQARRGEDALAVRYLRAVEKMQGGRDPG